MEPRLNFLQTANTSIYETPKSEGTGKVKKEVTPNSDQENKPSNGFDNNKSLVNDISTKICSDFIASCNKGSRILSRASNFIKNERITDPIEHNASIASIQSNFTVNPMFPSDIMGAAFDRARIDIEMLLDDFRKNVSLIRERDNIPTNKWDVEKHTLSEEFLKLREKPKRRVASVVKKDEGNSIDRVKNQNTINNLLNTISQGINCQVPSNAPNYLPVSQPFPNNAPFYQFQPGVGPQNYFINPQQQLPQQPQGMAFNNNVGLQQTPVQPTNDTKPDLTEEEMVAEEEKDRKLLKALERLSRIEEPLP